jgi:hypothetical protein
MLPSHTSKAYFKALIAACKRFGIYNYILFITTNNYIVNNGMCDRFEKYAFKYTKARFKSKPLLAIFKANEGHIWCLAYSINLSAQAVLVSLKSLAEKDTRVLYDNTKFVGKPTYLSTISKLRWIIVRYCCLALMQAALAQQCAAHRVKILKLFLDIKIY